MDIWGLCGFRPADLYDSDPMNMSREMVGECMSHGMGETLAVTHFFGDNESEEANCYIQKEHLAFLQEMQGQKCKDNGWIRDCGNGQPTGQA